MFPSAFNQLKIVSDLINNSTHSNVHMINFAKVYKAENPNISLTIKELWRKQQQKHWNTLVLVQIKKIHHYFSDFVWSFNQSEYNNNNNSKCL